MSELSREQVDAHLDVLDCSLSPKASKDSKLKLLATDAALRAKLEASEQHLEQQRTATYQAVEREHKVKQQLAAMTQRAKEAEAKWHRAATHDSSIDEAERIHELEQQLAEAQATIAWQELDRLRREHDCDEHCQDWTRARMDANKFRDERDQLQATVTALRNEHAKCNNKI